MSALVRVARTAELPEGSKVVKETHGRKILLARTRGRVFATDAHCFHMGGNLWEGDIEDVGGHACVVCPLHRYKIDMATGKKVDTMLDGCVTCTDKQQQRTYRVNEDGAFIWIDIPELHLQQALPSDRYNQVAAQPGGGTPGRGNYGLLGASSRAGSGQEALAPFAGFQARGLVPGTPAKSAGDDDVAMLSQESGIQLSQEPGSAQKQPQAQPAPHHFAQGHIPFAQSRVDTARIARRKAATAAILARGYNPPSARPLAQPAPSRGLFDSGAAPQPQPSQQVQQQQQAAARARAAGPAGQQSLLSFGFTVQQHSPAVSTGPDAMDME